MTNIVDKTVWATLNTTPSQVLTISMIPSNMPPGTSIAIERSENSNQTVVKINNLKKHVQAIVPETAEMPIEQTDTSVMPHAPTSPNSGYGKELTVWGRICAITKFFAHIATIARSIF